jgi:ABC-type multidrug transport system permease subunit
MEFIVVVAGLLFCILLYFCVGIALRFVWEWWILLISTPLLVASAVLYGWIGAVLSLILWFFSLTANNSWHSNAVYLKGSQWLDRTFNFSDT